MRHVSLTCKNHPNLRWSTKSIAVSNGGYNGARNIFFNGAISSPIRFYSDNSGVDCDSVVNIDGKDTVVRECDCKFDCLIVAPEDIELESAHKAKYPEDYRTINNNDESFHSWETV